MRGHEGNHIGDAGAVALSEPLKACADLEELKLGGKRFPEQSAWCAVRACVTFLLGLIRCVRGEPSGQATGIPRAMTYIFRIASPDNGIRDVGVEL